MVTRFLKRLINPLGSFPPRAVPPPANTALSRWASRIADALTRRESTMTTAQKKKALAIFLLSGTTFFSCLLFYALTSPDKSTSVAVPTGSFQVPPVARDSTGIKEVWSRLNQYSDTLQKLKNNDNTIYPK